jgi:hypothetical protein
MILTSAADPDPDGEISGWIIFPRAQKNFLG